MISEMLATIDGVSFIARASVDSAKNLINAKTLIEKGFQIPDGRQGIQHGGDIIALPY